MKAHQLIFIVVLILTICGVGRGDDCSVTDSTLQKMQTPAAVEFIRERFASADYSCAIHATRIQTESLVGLPGQEGIDARYALREMALDLARTCPSDIGLTLLQAASSSLAGGATSWSKAERQADVKMIFNAGEEFRKQQDISGWLDALIIAIRLDMQLPDDARRVPWDIGTLTPPTKSYKYIDKIATLAEITRRDKVMELFRCKLVDLAYYDMGVWREEDSREEILERCRQALRLFDAIKDVKPCSNSEPELYSWRLIFKVGIAYYRLGVTEEANKHIDKAIKIVRSIQNADYRLGRYRSVIVELRLIHYDRKVMLSLLDEMDQLANSLDTPMAKEIREMIPRFIRDYKLKE